MVLGAIAGYYGGVLDNVLMRFLDIYQSIPNILMSMVLATALGASTQNTITLRWESVRFLCMPELFAFPVYDAAGAGIRGSD